MTDTKTPNATQLKYDLIQDESTSRFVIDSIERLETKDPVDAINDLEIIKKWAELRLSDCQKYYK